MREVPADDDETDKHEYKKRAAPPDQTRFAVREPLATSSQDNAAGRSAVGKSTPEPIASSRVTEAPQSNTKAQTTSMQPRQGPVGSIAQEMVTIPAGEFVMGCSPGDDMKCLGGADLRHRVEVKAFRMGRYEVTQAQWQAVMGKNPSRFTSNDRPVENVSWDDIQAFLNRLAAIGFSPETALAIVLIPLVTVAWADCKLDDREREAILQAASERGVTMRG